MTTLSLPRVVGSARLREAHRRQGLDQATRRILLYGVLPVWIGAGLVAPPPHQHRDQALALIGRGMNTPDMRLRPKSRPLSRTEKAGAIGSILLLGAVPYAERLARCLRGSRGSQRNTPIET